MPPSGHPNTRKMSYIDRVAFKLKRWAVLLQSIETMSKKKAHRMREAYVKDVKEVFTGKRITGSSMNIMNQRLR